MQCLQVIHDTKPGPRIVTSLFEMGWSFQPLFTLVKWDSHPQVGVSKCVMVAIVKSLLPFGNVT